MNKTIKTTTKSNREETDRKNYDHRSLAKAFLEKEIIITLRNQHKLKGKLESVSQYELLIKTLTGSTLVLKHAIDYIELFESPE